MFMDVDVCKSLGVQRTWVNPLETRQFNSFTIIFVVSKLQLHIEPSWSITITIIVDMKIM